MKIHQIKTIVSACLLMLAAFGMVSWVSSRQTPWVIDTKYKTMKNPVKADATSIANGKALWMKNCASCHGKTGSGDGVKARTIETFSGDFSSPQFQSQTDGEIFGKTKVGREEMPKYDGKIPDVDIWALVNFMRTMKK